jgi:hypothetical protein
MEFSYAHDLPPGITITLQYDAGLQKITHKPKDPVRMSAHTPFGFLLETILISYPEISQKYSQGLVGFSIHGTVPKPYSPLFEGDVVSLFMLE